MVVLFFSVIFFIINCLIFGSLGKIFKHLGGAKVFVTFCIVVWLGVEYAYLTSPYFSYEKGYAGIYYIVGFIVLTCILGLAFGIPALMTTVYLSSTSKKNLEKKTQFDPKDLKKRDLSDCYLKVNKIY